MLNRTRELEYLDRHYVRPGAEFVVLYGRRRVGKTTLIYEWSQSKPALCFFPRDCQIRCCLMNFLSKWLQPSISRSVPWPIGRPHFWHWLIWRERNRVKIAMPLYIIPYNSPTTSLPPA